MTASVHNKIIKNAAKEILSPHGIIQKSQSRIWIDDNGWFLTIIEFQQSSLARGSYLNVGLFFLWDKQDHITFDYSVGSSRIAGKNGRQIFIEYKEDEQFKADATFLTNIALEKALYYRKFQDPVFATRHILSRKCKINSFYTQTWHKMMYCLFTNNKKAARYFKILSRLDEPEYYRQYHELLKFFQENYVKNPDAIKECLQALILEQREFCQSKGWIKTAY